VIFVETNSRGTSLSLSCSTVCRGVCGNYSGLVCLPVKMYERVKYGNVYRFNSYCYEWCLSTTYILVCLLAGAGVMPGGRCVVFCVMALSQPLVKMSYCRCTVRIYYDAWRVSVGFNRIPGFCVCHHCIFVINHYYTVCHLPDLLRV